MVRPNNDCRLSAGQITVPRGSDRRNDSTVAGLCIAGEWLPAIHPKVMPVILIKSEEIECASGDHLSGSHRLATPPRKTKLGPFPVTPRHAPADDFRSDDRAAFGGHPVAIYATTK